MTLIIQHVVIYAGPQLEISLTQYVSLIVQIIFYHIQGYVTVSVTLTPILDSRPSSRRICPGLRLMVTLIVRLIAA